jgi:amidase
MTVPQLRHDGVMSELWQKGALELAGLIRSSEVSSREVVEAHLVRVDKVNGQLNAIVRLLADEALTASDAADRAVAAAEIEGAVGRFTPIDPVNN